MTVQEFVKYSLTRRFVCKRNSLAYPGRTGFNREESIFPQFLLILGFSSKLDSELLRIYDGNVFIVIKSYIFKVNFVFIK
jgi:hypothetical protein